MGAWGTGLYQDDTTCDVKEEYLNLLKIGTEPEEAMEEMIINWEDCIEDVEEGPLFWFALAETQWRYGLLDEKVKEIALQYIEEGIDLERWEEDQKLYTKRKAELEKLKEKLESEQPKGKKIPKLHLIKRIFNTGDIILYQIQNEELKEHRWYKKYVLIKIVGLYKSGIGIEPIEKYHHETDVMSVYNWIGDNKPDIKILNNLHIINITEPMNFFDNDERDLTTGLNPFSKMKIKKYGLEVIGNTKKDTYSDKEVKEKFLYWHSLNSYTFDFDILRALEKAEDKGDLVNEIVKKQNNEIY